jgi:hypothetical protein
MIKKQKQPTFKVHTETPLDYSKPKIWCIQDILFASMESW